MADILIIDDDPVICDVLVQMMARISHHTRTALSGARGLELARNGLFDIVFLDVNLPDSSGLDLIHKIKDLPSSPEVIIITGETDPDGAELAIASGAWNYLEKPFLRQEIALQVKRALEFRREKGRVSSPGQLKRSEIIGESEILSACVEQVSIAAYSDVNVFISGEPGSGKELFAKTIHLNSDRQEGNFIIADCSAMNSQIAESLFFGSADDDNHLEKSGFIAMADHGTLLLDEVGDLPMEIQDKILEAISSQSYVPQGMDQRINSRFRVIATSRDDLASRVAAGLFRQDLLFLLQGLHIPLPPLRRLDQDITRLAIHYMKACCRKNQIEVKGVSPEFLGIVGEYPWPGNVRELINAMDKAVASARNEPTLYSIHLPSHVKHTIINGTNGEGEGDHFTVPSLHFGSGAQIPRLRNYLSRVEEQYLKCLWNETQQNIELACEISGISRTCLYKRLNKFEICSDK